MALVKYIFGSDKAHWFWLPGHGSSLNAAKVAGENFPAFQVPCLGEADAKPAVTFQKGVVPFRKPAVPFSKVTIPFAKAAAPFGEVAVTFGEVAVTFQKAPATFPKVTVTFPSATAGLAPFSA